MNDKITPEKGLKLHKISQNHPKITQKSCKSTKKL